MIIVQLGSNKGNDKLTEYIKNNNVNLELGLFVEAIPFHIDELKECYKDTPNSIIENIAIKLPDDEKKEMTIYYHLDDGPKYEVASFDKSHILKHYKTENIESVVVPSMSLEEILDKHNIKKIDWLLIDVEGLDAQIVETFNWEKYNIKRVDVEHIHWGDKKNDIFKKFYKMGYELIEANDNRYDVGFEKTKKEYNVIDTFVFGGELDLLKLRLDYLYDSVDHFVICESDKTHSGEQKELHYLNNMDNFKENQNKIHYVVFSPDTSGMSLSTNSENPFDTDFWRLEREQRNFIKDTVVELSNDKSLILHSDLDEVPNKSKFGELWDVVKNSPGQIISLFQPTYYYSPTCLLDIDWYGTVAFDRETLLKLGDYYMSREVRFNSKSFQDGGWHFSFFMTPEKIQHKILTYAHQEFNSSEITNIDNIKSKMYSGHDVLNRPNINIKKLDSISSDFPMEFYRHEVFFKNSFDRVYLKPQQVMRKNSSMQIPLEIENLQLSVANHQPKIILEIGSANGGTLARWFEIPSVHEVISVDYPVGIHGGQGFQERTYVISDALEQVNLTNKRFHSVNGDSRDPYLVNRVNEILNGRKIDFLFIDGDHTYEGVKGDFEIYKQFLSDDAIVGFHDVIDSQFHRNENCFVSKFWDELKEQYESKEFIYTEHLDLKILPYLGQTKKDGGFGGIGLIDYRKKKVLTDKLSIIVPIYNNVDDTINNLNVTLSHSKNVDDVILYSNGTDIDGVEKLKKFAQNDNRVRLFIVDKPIGFIKAVNESIKKSKNEFILCLNSDAHLFGDWEDRLLGLFKNSKYGVVGPVMARDFILGCCIGFKKSVINNVGMLDEGFGLGYEDDVEYCERVKNNGYELGYCNYKDDFGWTTEVNFPIYHKQGDTFNKIDSNIIEKLVNVNSNKRNKFKSIQNVVVLKNLKHDEVITHLNTHDNLIVVNNSGSEFEKIRNDENIIQKCKVLECTNTMNINNLIKSLTVGKNVTLIDSEEKKLTWLAKYDDFSSMGILSQKVLENLKNTDISCKEIIGETETKNSLIIDSIKKPNNTELGIMFSYPDMINELNGFKTKVVYTGVDTTGGIPNFVENCNKSDFLLTPSNISKIRMEKLGVKKPIFVFPHGVDTNLFKYKERKKSDVFKFLYVGECSDRKGIFQLFNAFTHLFSNNKNVELHIKSNTAMLFYGADRITEILKNHKNIIWHVSNEGHEKVIDLYDECHAYVYPSRADTFGMTLIEAMSCGLPIISTNDPGATELIEGRYFQVSSKNVPVKNHPWMLGEWGEPSVQDLIKNMKHVYNNYDSILNSGVLYENSKHIEDNYTWEKVVSKFEMETLPNLKKTTRVITLLTSFNRPHHIKNIINSLKEIRENGLENVVYIVENSNQENKEEILKVIRENVDDLFITYVSEFNMGQRGALLQLLEDINIDDYDFIQFTDQDNIFNEPVSTFCDILYENPDIFFTTGYMSKEHEELAWRETRFGNLCEKKSLRAGHMVMRTSDLKSLFPIHLDAHYGQPYNSSWNAGLDWELSWWNPKSPGKNMNNNFVLCVPGGVLHKGVDSTMYEWDVEGNEYKLEELISLRKKPNE